MLPIEFDETEQTRASAQLLTTRAESPHLIQPARTPLLIHTFDIADERGSGGFDATALNDVPLQTLEAMDVVPPPIHPCRHAHRHHDTRRLSGE